MLQAYIGLLQQLIAIPSFSRKEDKTASLIFDFLQTKGSAPHRYHNNVYSFCKHYSSEKPSLLLCSHHDTVRPANGYTRDPFSPIIENGILYGLGSNDAGASVVSLIATYCHFYKQDLPFNVVLAIVAEEEVHGSNGIKSVIPLLGKIDCAIVGEPTQMQAAIGERGLMVLDCIAEGVQGHAARNEGDNALYHAVDDIQWLRSYKFPKISPLMGEVKMTATMINCGTQHNVIPAECKFVVDIRPTDQYTNLEILEVIHTHIKSTVMPRSTHIVASSIDRNHPLVIAAESIACSTYISPTTSDMAMLNMPSLKMGPGDSSRSHTADEYIALSEIEEGISLYVKLLGKIKFI
ncbi:MAG: M20 family metallo-hydrolase [Bacteroidales bacterium]